MKIHILGQVRLQMHGHVHVSSTKVRGLLGYLAYRANESVHVDRIVEALWDDDRPPDPAKGLQTYVSRLRRVLRDSGSPASLEHEHRSYRLRLDPSTVDYHEFASTVRNGYRARGSGRHHEAVDLFTSALRLWTGPPLADLDTSWARRLRDTLTTRDLIPAHCALFDTILELGDHEPVFNALPALLADHANDEQLAGRWIRALAAAKRSGEVPAFYREFTQRLLDDLGVEPSSELVQIFTEASTAHRPTAVAVTKPAPPRTNPFFTGHGQLLEQLDDLLLGDGEGDAVALDGPPGIGKTTLAKYWARRQQEHFPDGVLIADMAGYSNAPLVQPHTVMVCFLEELGIAQIPVGTNELAAVLRNTLSTRRVLALIDNVRSSSQVRPLLAAVPGPKLITSRRRLTGIVYHDGVRALTVPALSPPDSAALLDKHLGERATDAPEAVDKLVDLCHGLPLALWITGEHIAARPAAPIDELAGELAHARRLLDAGTHGDDDDAITLRATFAWSYHALHAAEQRIFDLIGLHPGTHFGARVIAALAADTTDNVEGLLDSLVGAHLVVRERGNRYLVHDLLHAYATTAAQDHEPAAPYLQATRRMLDWYLESARHARAHVASAEPEVPALPPSDPVEPMDFVDTDAALRWLVTERANLVACTYRAAELGYHEHVWRFSACLNVLSHYEAPEELLEIHELGRRAAEQVGEAAAAGGCWNNKGAVFSLLSDYARAGLCFEMAYQAFTEASDLRGIAVTTHNTGVTYLNLGQPVEAIEWLTKGLGLNTRIGDEWAIANSHRRLGDANSMLNRVTEAQAAYRQAAYASQRAGDALGHGKALSRLADLALAQDRVEDATRYGEAALDVLDRAQVDRGATAATLCILATTHLRGGATTEATRLADEAVHTYHEAQNVTGEIDALIVLGRALFASGEATRAAGTWTTASQLLASPEDPRTDVLHELLETTADRPVPPPRTQADQPLTSGRPPKRSSPARVTSQRHQQPRHRNSASRTT